MPEQHKPIAKFFVSGGVAFAFELCGGHYIEFAKIAKQVSNDSYMQITRKMIGQKGLVGILDGYFPWGALQAVVKGGVFGFGQALGKYGLNRFTDLPEHVKSVISGGIGGGIQGLALSPVLLLKTRVMTDDRFRAKGGMWSTAVASSKVGFEVVKNEGALTLMKGSAVFSLKRVADWSTRYLFAELCEVAGERMKGDKLTFGERSFASFCGGWLSATVTIPIDVMVATIQDAKKAGKKVSVMKVWRNKVRESGLIGWLRFSSTGYIARVGHVALTTLLMKTVATQVYDSIFHKH